MFQICVEVTEHEVLIDLLRAIQRACPTLLIRIAHVGANVSAAGAAEGGGGQRSAPDTAPTPAFSPIRVTAQQPTRVEPVAAHLARQAWPSHVDETCAVCLERMRDVDEFAVLCCGHGFHAGCLHGCVRCPVCRGSSTS